MDKKWEILSSDYPLRSKWLNVRKDHVKMPKGVELDDFYIRESGSGDSDTDGWVNDGTYP